MNNPFFWLGISILLVAISLMALLTVAILTLQELARAARSAEKLLDTLNRELPPTLNDLRLTGKELSQLSDEVSGGMQSARNVVEQVDKGLVEAKVQAQRAGVTTRSLLAGATAAFRVLTGPPRRRRRRPPTRRPPVTSNEPIDETSDTLSSAQKATPKSTEPKPSKARPIERHEPKTSTPPKPTTSTDLPETSTSLPTKSP